MLLCWAGWHAQMNPEIFLTYLYSSCPRRNHFNNKNYTSALKYTNALLWHYDNILWYKMFYNFLFIFCTTCAQCKQLILSTPNVKTSCPQLSSVKTGEGAVFLWTPKTQQQLQSNWTYQINIKATFWSKQGYFFPQQEAVLQNSDLLHVVFVLVSLTESPENGADEAHSCQMHAVCRSIINYVDVLDVGLTRGTETQTRSVSCFFFFVFWGTNIRLAPSMSQSDIMQIDGNNPSVFVCVNVWHRWQQGSKVIRQMSFILNLI